MQKRVAGWLLACTSVNNNSTKHSIEDDEPASHYGSEALPGNSIAPTTWSADFSCTIPEPVKPIQETEQQIALQQTRCSVDICSRSGIDRRCATVVQLMPTLVTMWLSDEHSTPDINGCVFQNQLSVQYHGKLTYENEYQAVQPSAECARQHTDCSNVRMESLQELLARLVQLEKDAVRQAAEILQLVASGKVWKRRMLVPGSLAELEPEPSGSCTALRGVFTPVIAASKDSRAVPTEALQTWSTDFPTTNSRGSLGLGPQTLPEYHALSSCEFRLAGGMNMAKSAPTLTDVLSSDQDGKALPDLSNSYTAGEMPAYASVPEPYVASKRLLTMLGWKQELAAVTLSGTSLGEPVARAPGPVDTLDGTQDLQLLGPTPTQNNKQKDIPAQGFDAQATFSGTPAAQPNPAPFSPLTSGEQGTAQEQGEDMFAFGEPDAEIFLEDSLSKSPLWRPLLSQNPGLLATSRARSAPLPSQPPYLDTLEENGTVQPVWHDITVQMIEDPETGRPCILLLQQDVTREVGLQRRLADLADCQLSMMSQIFPAHVLEQLASTKDEESFSCNISALARSHQQATILFLDVVGFTSMSDSCAPADVMTFLNQLFSLLDHLVDDHGVHKVETAGDCYIVSSGVLTADTNGFYQIMNQPVDAAHEAGKVYAFAKHVLQAVQQVRMPHNGEAVKVRIGLHTGPCVSGLVGTKLPKFSIFGDTMNTASRMESTCPPGHVQVSASTHALLRQEDMLAKRGVQVKGKGFMETYVWCPPGTKAPQAAAAAGAGGAASPARGPTSSSQYLATSTSPASGKLPKTLPKVKSASEPGVELPLESALALDTPPQGLLQLRPWDSAASPRSTSMLKPVMKRGPMSSNTITGMVPANAAAAGSVSLPGYGPAMRILRWSLKGDEGSHPSKEGSRSQLSKIMAAAQMLLKARMEKYRRLSTKSSPFE